MNSMWRKNAFFADKYAAELGYSNELTAVLAKIAAAKGGEGDVHWTYSLLHHERPPIEDRLVELERLRVKEEGKIALAFDVE